MNVGLLVARRLVLVGVIVFTGCGGASDGPGNPGAGGTAGGGSGGLGAGGTGTGGSSGSGGRDGGGRCEGRDYCGCRTSPECVVLSEACFCPCGEVCEPTCACVCGGGKYLGCTASSIAAPGQLEGIWLVGWSGGLEHYSWVRFDADGSAHVLDGSAIGTNAPYWPCNGSGSWVWAQKPDTVFLTLPAGCTTAAESLGFVGIKAPQGGFPRNALFGVSIDGAASGQPLEGWKFPASQCNAAFTVCADPFGFPP